MKVVEMMVVKVVEMAEDILVKAEVVMVEVKAQELREMVEGVAIAVVV